MATATPQAKYDLADDNRRIRSPLERLRGYIRSYVTLEGLTTALVFMTLWFWIGLLLDYGVFRLTSLFIPGGLDWVQIVPWWLRAVVLTGLLAWLGTLVITRVAVRLFKEFQDSSLALVLERRFPRILEDRLITAVELSDPEKASQYGYSKAMVRETIKVAAEKVDQLPLQLVFDWKRIWRTGWRLLLLGGLGYLLASLGLGLLARSREPQPLSGGFGRFHDVATIWAERNLLLRNTIWPRETFLQIIEPDVDELRIGRNTPPPSLRVRSYRYIVEDSKDPRRAPEGWRPLLWSDIASRPELLGKDFNVTPPPIDWKARDEKLGLTVDEVELQLEQFDVRHGNGWTIADDRAPGNVRPLRWIDLKGEIPAGQSLPPLPPYWPQVLAGAIATSSGQAGPLLASTSIEATHGNIPVDQIETWLANIKDPDNRLPDTLIPLRNLLDRLKRYDLLRQTLNRLEERATNLSLSRTLRKLDIPPEVNLSYNNNTKYVSKTLLPSARNPATGNEFTGGFSELEASAYGYTASANDYSTPRRYITVLPPPELASLLVEQERPAYLYYRPSPGKTGQDLRGKRQHFAGVDILERGGGLSRLDDLPSGTSVTLIGQANAPLKSVVIKPSKEGDATVFPQPAIEDRTFRVRFEEVRRELDMQITFVDRDGVVNQRQVLLRPREDLAPELLDVQPDSIIRKNKEGSYIVSVKARVPFSGKVQDDHGLAGIRYVYTLSRLETGPKINVAALLTLSGLPGLGSDAAHAPLIAALTSQAAIEARARPTGSGDVNLQKEQVVPVSEIVNRANREKIWARNVLPRVIMPANHGFDTMVEETEGKLLSWNDLEARLAKPLSLSERPKMVSNYTIKSDSPDNPERDPLGNDFALLPLNLQALSSRDLQPRYRMQLWVEAIDTDVESQMSREAKLQGTGIYAGVPLAAVNPASLMLLPALIQVAQRDLNIPEPHISPSKEKFNFLVVSENELLTEIAKEEEELRIQLEEVDKFLDEGERKLSRELVELSSGAIKPANLGAVSQRLDRILEVVLDKQQVKCKEVSDDYRRILEELKTNLVDDKIIKRVESTIVNPLQTIADKGFGDSRGVVATFKVSLDTAREANSVDALGPPRAEGARALASVRQLRESLKKVLDSMERLTDINKLIKSLREIEETEQAQADLFNQIRQELEKQILEGATEDPKKP